MGTVGIPEMIMIFIVALVLFGPKKLPELGRTIGKAITEFRRASNELKASFEREMNNLERETQALERKSSTPAIAPPSTSATYSYDDGGEYIPDYEHTATIPSTVSASESSGAESQGTADHTPHEHHKIAELPPVEGTVPRTAGQEAPQQS